MAHLLMSVFSARTSTMMRKRWISVVALRMLSSMCRYGRVRTCLAKKPKLSKRPTQI